MPKVIMKGETVEYARKALGLTHKSFAALLFAKDADCVKKWEVKGLRAPHDSEGPTAMLLKMLMSEKLGVRIKKDVLKTLHYHGPEKKFKDVELLRYIKPRDWK